MTITTRRSVGFAGLLARPRVLLLVLAGAWLAPLACAQTTAPEAATTAPAASRPAGIELTRGATWEYRVVGKAAWTADPREALAALGAAPRLPAWPKAWATFTPWGTDTAGASDDPSRLEKVPADLTLFGQSACRATLPVDERGILDIAAGQGAPRKGRWAYAFSVIDAPAEQDLLVHFGSDGPVSWWLDQKPLQADGGVLRMSLAQGKHVVAMKIVSGEQAWQVTTSVTAPGEPVGPALEARCVFDLPEVPKVASLTFDGPDGDRVQLNGQALPLALPGMLQRRVTGIPATMLKAGRNELTKSWTAAEARRGLAPGKNKAVHGQGVLLGVAPAAVSFQSGPMITQADQSTLTISCRTTALAPLSLRIAGRELRSPAGLFHHFRVEGLEAGKAYPYTIGIAEAPAAERSGTARTLPAAGPVTIGLVGDSRGGPAVWGRIAADLRQAKVDVVTHSGDIALDGLDEATWDTDFFHPAAGLLANVPVLAVLGNHERQSPLFDRFFTKSLGARNWSRTVGTAMVLGIDALGDWSAGSAQAKWLEQTLAGSDAKFIFVITHYPPYSSSTHGRVTADGRPGEAPTRASRELILPILQRYHVTAVVCGHDHCYERSEPPGGVTVITSAGGGAGLYGKRADAATQNPHSRVYAVKHHYCLARIDGDTCTLTAIDTDGQVLDTVTWQARKMAK